MKEYNERHDDDYDEPCIEWIDDGTHDDDYNYNWYNHRYDTGFGSHNNQPSKILSLRQEYRDLRSDFKGLRIDTENLQGDVEDLRKGKHDLDNDSEYRPQGSDDLEFDGSRWTYRSHENFEETTRKLNDSIEALKEDTRDLKREVKVLNKAWLADHERDVLAFIFTEFEKKGASSQVPENIADYIAQKRAQWQRDGKY